MKRLPLPIIALIAGSLLLPLPAFSASKATATSLMPYGSSMEEPEAVNQEDAAPGQAAAQVVEGKVVKAVTGAHDTEGYLEILPLSGNGERLADLAIFVPNNASIQRSDIVEKTTGETGVAFFRHIHVGDTVTVAYSQQKAPPATTLQNVAEKVEIRQPG